jgi:hypothetical protein
MSTAKYLIQATETNPNSDKFFEMINKFNNGESDYKFKGNDGQKLL